MDLGTILKSIILSERITTITLDKIFRQAAKSKIILNAHNVNSGEYFITNDAADLKKDFFFVKEANQEKIVQFILSLYKDGIRKFEGYEDFKSIQIITPSKKGICGTRELNKRIQELVNPALNKSKEKSYRTINI